MTITTGAAVEPDDGSPLEAGSDVGPGISLAIAPDVVVPDATPPAPEVADDEPVDRLEQAAQPSEPEPSPEPDLVAVDSPLLAVTALSTTEPAPAAAPVPLADRLRRVLPFTGPGLTGLGGALLGILLVGVGASVDLAAGGGLGAGFDITFLVGCVLVAAVVRVRALVVAAVLPPLLFAGGYGVETMAGGQTTGRRAMALDVATSLALHAPVLFVGAALAIVVALGRVVVHLVRR